MSTGTEKSHQNTGGKGKGGDTRFGGPRGNPICKETQFGGKRGNPRGHGFFKKEDTPRFKLEKMFALSEDELKEIVKSAKTSSYSERKLATFILKGDWKTFKEMIDEVYGLPKVTTENTNIDYTPLVDLTKRKKNGEDNIAK